MNHLPCKSVVFEEVTYRGSGWYPVINTYGDERLLGYRANGPECFLEIRNRFGEVTTHRISRDEFARVEGNVITFPICAASTKEAA